MKRVSPEHATLTLPEYILVRDVLHAPTKCWGDHIDVSFPDGYISEAHLRTCEPKNLDALIELLKEAQANENQTEKT